MSPIPGRLEVAHQSIPAITTPRAALSTTVSIFNRLYASHNGGAPQGLGAVLSRHIAASRRPSRAAIAVEPSGPGDPDTQRVLGDGAKSDYLLIVDSEAPFATKLTAELAAAGLQTIRATDAESAKDVLARKSRATVVVDLRYAALPLTAAFLIAEALGR